jgi:hypothetical protein
MPGPPCAGEAGPGPRARAPPRRCAARGAGGHTGGQAARLLGPGGFRDRAAVTRIRTQRAATTQTRSCHVAAPVCTLLPPSPLPPPPCMRPARRPCREHARADACPATTLAPPLCPSRLSRRPFIRVAGVGAGRVSRTDLGATSCGGGLERCAASATSRSVRRGRGGRGGRGAQGQRRYMAHYARPVCRAGVVSRGATWRRCLASPCGGGEGGVSCRLVVTFPYPHGRMGADQRQVCCCCCSPSLPPPSPTHPPTHGLASSASDSRHGLMHGTGAASRLFRLREDSEKTRMEDAPPGRRLTPCLRRRRRRPA